MTVELVKAYLKRHIHFGEFELHSGVVTNYYIDIRPLFLDSLITYDTAMMMFTKLNPDIQFIAGVEKSGFIIVPSLIAICHHRPLKGVLVRKIPKMHGLCRMVEGDRIPLGSKMAIVDDIITTGASLRFATRAVEEEYGAEVVQWLTLVDRTEGKVKTPVPLVSVFKAEDLLAS
jgi:orotate phosphoribosyltransferase